MGLKEMVFAGLYNGIVRIIQSPNDGCIACKIGEYWFYFIGSEDENMTPDEVYASYKKEELAELIVSAMRELDETELAYYEAYLHDKYSEITPEELSLPNGDSVAGAKEFQQRVKKKLMQIDGNIKEDDLCFSQTVSGYYMEYKPNYPDKSNGDFIVCQDLNGSISVYGNMDALVPTSNHYEDIADFEKRL